MMDTIALAVIGVIGGLAIGYGFGLYWAYRSYSRMLDEYTEALDQFERRNS